MAGKTPDSKGHVRVWDPKTLNTLVVLGQDVFTGGVCSVAFSTQSGNMTAGSYLLAVDDSEKRTLAVWEWKTRKLIARTILMSDMVVWATFHPQDFTTVVTFGRQFVNFWKLFVDVSETTIAAATSTNLPTGAGRLLRDKQSGTFEVDEIPNLVMSVVFGLNGDVITGDSSGRIFVWSKENSTEAFNINRQASENMRHAHEKSVLALCMLDDGTLLSGGGTEIKAWDSMNFFKRVKERSVPEGVGNVRSITTLMPGGTDGALYVATTNNVVLHGSLQDKLAVLIQGHSEELWAIAAHPLERSFVTAGYDQCAILWNADRHSLIWKTQLEKPCVSVTFEPRGRCVAVGTTTGRFIVLDAATGSHLVSVQLGTESLDAISFSPDGRLLAIGCQDSLVYIYEALDNFQVFRRYKNGILRGHENFVSQLDWSRDSRYLQTVSGDYDLLYWNVHEMAKVPAKMARDVTWMTQTCTLGYDVIGAWSNLREGQDINTVARTNSSTYLATGDNCGTVSIYKYPCNAERPERHQRKLCTGHVMKVCFVGSDDHFLVTSGGSDAAIMQWEMNDSASRSSAHGHKR